MTYIKLDTDMRLIVTKSDTIYSGDNLSKKITFLLPVNVGGFDLENTTIFLSYVRADGTPDIVILNREDSMYDKNHYSYVIPVTCKLTRYPGEVRMWLQLLSGNSTYPAFASSEDCTIRIKASHNVDNCLNHHQLTALYQLKKSVENMDDNGESWEDMTTPNSVPDGEYWEDM